MTVLVTKLIENITKLLYYKEVDEFLPDKLKKFIHKEQKPMVEIDEENTDFKKIEKKFLQKLNDKEMEQFLTSEESELVTMGQKLANNFFLCLLDRSSRSLTHFETYFKRYYSTIQTLLQQNNNSAS